MPQFTSEVPFEGSTFKLHYVHLPSSAPSAIPLLLLHGWPGSYIEFLDVIKLLAKAGFSVVAPSSPGYAFSQKTPVDRDFGMGEWAKIADGLMTGLGYSEYAVQVHAKTVSRLRGADLSLRRPVTGGRRSPGRLRRGSPPAKVRIALAPLPRSLTPRMRSDPSELRSAPRCSRRRPSRAFGLRAGRYQAIGVLFVKGQCVCSRTRHATQHNVRLLSLLVRSLTGLRSIHALYASPIAMLAWIGEKCKWNREPFFASADDRDAVIQWTDQTPDLDKILDCVTLWWLTDTFPYSLYMYRESVAPPMTPSH